MHSFSWYQALACRFFLSIAIVLYFFLLVDPRLPSLTFLPKLAIPFSTLFIPNIFDFLPRGQFFILNFLILFLASLFSIGFFQRFFGSILLYIYLCTYCSLLPVFPTPVDGFLPFLLFFFILLFSSGSSIFSSEKHPYSINLKLLSSSRLILSFFYITYGVLSLYTCITQEGISFREVYWSALCTIYGTFYSFSQTRQAAWILFTISIFLFNFYGNLPFLFSAIAVQIFMLDSEANLFAPAKKKAVVFIDGFCVLCSKWAQFIIREDRNFIFKIATLQGNYGEKYLDKELREEVNTIVLQVGNNFYKKSGAVLRILDMLGGVWSIFSIFLLLPSFLRDFFYDYISSRRYKIFAKKEECSLPSQLEKDRVLD